MPGWQPLYVKAYLEEPGSTSDRSPASERLVAVRVAIGRVGNVGGRDDERRARGGRGHAVVLPQHGSTLGCGCSSIRAPNCQAGSRTTPSRARRRNRGSSPPTCRPCGCSAPRWPEAAASPFTSQAASPWRCARRCPTRLSNYRHVVGLIAASSCVVLSRVAHSKARSRRRTGVIHARCHHAARRADA